MGCLFVSILMAAPSSAQVSKNRSGWLNDFSTAKAEAKKTGKPILVVFRCEQCPDCADIDAGVVRLDKEIADLADMFVRVRLTRVIRGRRFVCSPEFWRGRVSRRS